MSQRQLHRRCVAAFGYGPKMLGRVLRMNAVALRAAGCSVRRGRCVLATPTRRTWPGTSRRWPASRCGPHLAAGSGAKRSTAIPVGVVDDGVTLTPERIPRLEVADVARADKTGIDAVDFGGVRTREGEAHAVAARRRRPFGSKERMVSIVSRA